MASLDSLLPTVRQEMRSLVTPGPRMVDEFECLAAILLSIVIAHQIGAHTVSWAAITALVMMRGHAADSFERGVLRMIGTVMGAGLALIVVPYAVRSLPTAMLAAGIFGTAAMYATLTGKRSYAWLMFGLTYEMILFDKVQHPNLNTIDFVATRILEVSAGAIACLIVSGFSTITVRQRYPATQPATPARLGWHPNAARHALQTGVALALLPLIDYFIPLPEMWQACITVMAVMIVPASSIGVSGLIPVSKRIGLRAAGCAIGGTLAAGVLLLAQSFAPSLIMPLLVLGVCLGVIVGRHIENSGTIISYLGLQFTLAVLVVLVPDSYDHATLKPGLNRLISIFVGMAILLPVLLAWHAIARDAKPEPEAAPDSK